MKKKDRDALIREHYRGQAAKSGGSWLSTMPDEIVRTRELEAILAFVSALHSSKKRRRLRVLDLGCGNGYALKLLSNEFSCCAYTGVDFSPEMLKQAVKQRMRGVRLLEGDARDLRAFANGAFDLVYTERCLINILDWREQERALREIGRVLRPGGYYLILERFTDGLVNLNRARGELGLEEVKEAYHNKYLDKKKFLAAIEGTFTVVDSRAVVPKNPSVLQPNYLSSHHFISRVLYPAVTKGEVRYNTDFVKFFSYLPPVGDYSSDQIYILKKRASHSRASIK